MNGKISKLSLMFRDELDLDKPELDNRFTWKISDDLTWEFNNEQHVAKGYVIPANYSGAHGALSPNDHNLNLGDVLGIKNGKCWRVKYSNIPEQFECFGIALGWYENSDATLILISGVIKNIGQNWIPGNKIYLPNYSYGNPIQTIKTNNATPIGIALSKTDMLLIPGL